MTGFHPLGTLAPEGIEFGGDDKVLTWPPQLTTPGTVQIVTECQDCPTTHDPEYGRTLKQEWVWTDEHEAAEFALQHMRDLGHDVNILHRTEMTFTMFEGPGPVWSALWGPDAASFFLKPDPWAELLRLGDCGDVADSYTPDSRPRHLADSRCRRTSVMTRWWDRAGREHSYEGTYWRRWLP